MSRLPILKFEPILKSVVWGGRRLESHLGRALPTAEPFGESWELVDLPGDQSKVCQGQFEGTPLEDLLKTHREEILGSADLLDGRFPLLFKFIDAAGTLSVQVHPDEEACLRLGDHARPKTEAWYIIDCEPGAALYAGLQADVDRATFEKALKEGEVEGLLHRLPVTPGDFVFLPAGTIHAIGAGIMLAEVQQSSNTTYRVFDWNRIGLDGNPRQLHIRQALDSIDYRQVGPPVLKGPESGRPGLVCPFFSMELLQGRISSTLRGEGPMVIMGVGGEGGMRLVADGEESTVGLGESALVPASRAGRVEVSCRQEAVFLAVRIPASQR